jgi:hypothetical protein
MPRENAKTPTFRGLASGYEECCRVHTLEPLKCVAFEGTDTGKKFYKCSLQNVSPSMCMLEVEKHHCLLPLTQSLVQLEIIALFKLIYVTSQDFIKFWGKFLLLFYLR